MTNLEMKITVGIPSFGRPEFLVLTARQVLAQNHPAVCEIIVADQTPWDDIDKNWQDAIARIRQEPLVQYFTLEKPNLPGARNFILQKAKGELIIWLDDDVLLPPGFIEAHRRSYLTDNCGGSVIAVAGNPIHRVMEMPDERLIDFDNYKKYCSPHYAEPTVFTCDWQQSMIGANHSVLRSYAIEAEGYDENILGGYAEDTDFTCRLKKRFPEKSITYNPDAWVIHLRSKTGGCRIEKRNKWSEYATVIGPHLCYARHKQGISFFQSIRMSPLRRENVIHFWRQPMAWFDFSKSLVIAYLLRKKVKSPFQSQAKR